jgi:TRAP-type C4-dicarboxylate transport system permease small subunit
MRMNWEVELPTVSWMTMGTMYMVVFLSALVMIFYLLVNLCREIAGRRAGGPGGAA